MKPCSPQAHETDKYGLLPRIQSDQKGMGCWFRHDDLQKSLNNEN